MAYDPVLDREMFRPKAKSKGLEDLRDSEDPAVIARREQALAMIEMAKQKFDPANYQTLREQDRPGVFRPVAVNMPAQQPTADTAMRMQQMANMGMRPIGMADGGDPADKIKPTIESPGIFERISRFMYPDGPQTMAVGSNAKYSLPDVGLRIGKEDQTGITGLPEAGKVSPGREPPEVSSTSKAYMGSPADWTEEEIQQMADELFNRGQGGTDWKPKSAFGRGVQSVLPIGKASRDAVVKELRDQKEVATRAREESAGQRLRDAAEEKRRQTMIENPVSSIFADTEPGQIEREQAAQTAALAPINAEDAARISAAEDKRAAREASTPQSIAGLVGYGRGAVERPGERKAYMDAIVKKNRTAGGGGGGDTTEDTDKKYTTSLPDIKRDREDAFNMALMQAGLAMMAGKSSNALANIGEGGIAGLQAYASQLGQARARALEERKLGMMEKYYGSREKASGIAAARLQQEYVKALSNARSKAESNWNDVVKNDPTLGALQTKDPAAFAARKKIYVTNQLQDFNDQFESQVSVINAASPDPELTKTFEGFE